MSPIEKLLMKNGASSPNSTGFEADAEDLAVRPVRKQLKRKMKRISKAKVANGVDSQSLVVENKGKGEEIDNEPIHDTENSSNENEETNTTKCETEVETEAEAEATTDTAVEVNVPAEDITEAENPTESKELTEEPKDVEKPSELPFALPQSTSIEVELKSPPDVSSSTFTQPEVNSSLKSPSSVSIDSAKGLSIVTDPGWPTYQVGDLFWGKVFSYCFWPCMVCPDPFGQIVGNMPSHPQRSSVDAATVPIQVHVRFFADNGRRNWIKPENLLPFAGLPAFEELREEVRIKHGPKSAKYRQMNPKRAKLTIWMQAIEEAQVMTEVPYTERLEKFYQIYESAV